MIISGPIESFFKNPKDNPSAGGDCILYHLRRDLENLYGPETDLCNPSSFHVLLTLIGIFSGIDYLSKVYSSKDGSRGKFVEMIKDLCKISSDDAEAIYQFRCALVHSMSLSTTSSCSHRNGVQFIFEITDDKSLPLIYKLSDYGDQVTYRICLAQMKSAFIQIILKLENIGRDVMNEKNSHVINMIGQLHLEKILKSE
jgi:hypothetical protein